MCAWFAVCAGLSGCATMRREAPSPDLRPCTDGYAYTADGWRLGIRHYRPSNPDPNKLPVVLCHGLGLNATFWTITENHLPAQLNARGYDVFVFDIRGSGENGRPGVLDRINSRRRQTPFREWGERWWNVDDLMRYDVPAILDYVQRDTGHERVNWIGHSMGGMLMFPYLELEPANHERIASFVAMGSTIIQAETPQRDMLRANRALRLLSVFASPGRLGRPLTYFRMPGMGAIDSFYYSDDNVDDQTVARFYGYTLEDPGPGAFRQLNRYLQEGHMYSADGQIDYSSLLDRVRSPILMVAGEADILSDVPSTELTFQGLGSPDKTLMIFGTKHGQIADYGHCDLVWSRHAPREVFPPLIDWLDRHQPAGGIGTRHTMAPPVPLAPASTSPQQ
jgi:lysosomal acid lipase/cholesteryl ester hydrolase